MTVYHRGLGIENSAKIVSVTYDVLLERYQTMTVGDVRTNLTDTMRAISAEINKDNPTVSAIKNAISHATTIISGGLGGNVVINTNEDGQPIEILAMNTADITSATYILRLSKEGISVSTTGYAGPYTTVIQLSGGISSDFLRGVIDAALVKKGSLADRANNITWNMITGAFKGTNMEITTLTSETVNADSLKADQTDAGELTATTIDADSVETDAVDADVVGAQTVIAETVEAASVSADTVSSGDGFTGTFHIPGTADALGCTISIRDGIITGLVEDEPPEPEDPDPQDPDPQDPDPQEPDPEEPDPSEEGE